LFIKWFTSYEKNIEFVSQTGYLPVTKKAYESQMTEQIQACDK
jgi:multiple sugar transport system substrate-binding protein